MQKKIITAGILLLTGAFLLTTQTSAAESAAKDSKLRFIYDKESGKTVGPKDIVWSKPTEVTFSHKIHTADAGLTCETCHDDLFSMKSGAVLKSGEMTMAAMAEGKFCGTCHDGSTAFATNTKCSACHTNLGEIVPADPVVWSKPVKAVTFSHNAHVKDFGLECEACHDDLFTMKTGTAEKADDFTMQALYDGKYCGACHDGSTAFASNTKCNACHIGLKGYNRLNGSDVGHGATHDTKKAGH